MPNTVRMAFVDEIKEMEQDVIKMGSVVEQMLHKSIEALTSRDVALADEAIAMDDIVDNYNISIEEHCLRLLALQQPMARDLRHIAATMKIITDIERMGDYVVDIAKTAKELSARPLFKPLVNIPKMTDIVKKMLREVLEAFINHDLDLIQQMIEDDDKVDQIDKNLQHDLTELMKKDQSIVNQAIQLILISRYLERFADHVTNVGERVYYMETGEMKEMHT